MFQVISIKDDDDNDVTDQYNIDAGMHYSSLREVIIEMGLDPDKVDYEEEE